MRMGKANVVAPLTSPEEPPAMSYAAVSFFSPVCLSIAGVLHVSRRAEGGSRTWAAPCLGRAGVACACLWAIRSVRAGPASRVGFKFIFGFYSFHIFVYRFKNMYLLDGRSK